ncbi:hypothetical protein MPC4_70155 [Methylocella tundrae]|uniref:Uncharacterized protein n=1 Tax=Methylocella tundrae TaxID=227605 RepID=A0A8B6MB50_METTU|nr:hypothetical protein MPC1_510003 [Methylocella tundrae]VTZ52267.1 hypothetical protein MPC4_70155 [Methylocella tundrae]
MRSSGRFFFKWEQESASLIQSAVAISYLTVEAPLTKLCFGGIAKFGDSGDCFSKTELKDTKAPFLIRASHADPRAPTIFQGCRRPRLRAF